MRARALLLAAVPAALFASPAVPRAAAAEKGPFRLWLQAGLVAGKPSFSETRTFTEFAEQGRIDSHYDEDSGPGVEGGLGWRFTHRFAVHAAASWARRKEAGSYSAALPHPLYFAMPRHAAGDFSGRSIHETAVHLDLAVVGGSGLEWSVFAGPSVIETQADLVQAIEYTHAYPYDAVTVTGAPLASVRGHALGFNAGAGLDWHVGPHVALGLQSRFSQANVKLQPAAGDEVAVKAGGLLVSAGLRLDF